jgi:hypothetical protein
MKSSHRIGSSTPQTAATGGDAVSRRSFLKTGATLAAAATMTQTFGAPAIVGASDKTDAKPLILGSGDHTYECITDWAKLPDNIHFGNTHAVQETADGRIFVHHTGQESVCVFDPDGKFIESWGKEYVGAAHGMDLRKEGSEEFLYLAPTGQHRVVKTNLKGEVVFALEYPKDAKKADGTPCYPDEKTYVPTFIAFGPNGDFYVTDGYGAGFVHRYNGKGEYISSFAGKGNADDQTNCPHGIYLDARESSNPLLVVADRGHHRLQYFTLDGKLDHLVTNDKPEENQNETGKLRATCHFNIRGEEILIPDLRGRVTVLDKSNNVIVQLGDNPNASQRANNKVKKEDLVDGIFCCPHGATWDRAGNIYVAEWLPYGRVTKLRKV